MSCLRKDTASPFDGHRGLAEFASSSRSKHPGASELDLDRLTETFAGRVSKEWQIEEPWQWVVPRKEGRF